ncbi:GNAT family N-acetyltransferase [Halosimplex rubrum]|uniref:GNAT family N-acetyltransferase n=1 Tax=Halosimplex rubrum TaxID=869889 RepID=A0A7D5NZV1_9EURY|nr:GNAT family N-acetyltransferase [Halosimplex rubrum]QLH77117.1 GNAT family N-acetyltransferase [Halosimplex rubrum]
MGERSAHRVKVFGIEAGRIRYDHGIDGATLRRARRMSTATVRSVRRDELDDLLELYRQLNPADPELAPEEVAGQWDEMIADADLDIVVVEHDGRLVATCLLSVTKNLTRGARPFALVENVVTREEYRGEGFGTQCVEGAVERARERGCYKVMLLTGSDEAWTHEFYESCGFDSEAKTGFTLDLR